MNQAARDAVRRRAEGGCEVNGPGCRGVLQHVHHRVVKGMGGALVVESPEWLVAVCGPCHAHVHAHPDESYRKGWMVRRSEYERWLEEQDAIGDMLREDQ